MVDMVKAAAQEWKTLPDAEKTVCLCLVNAALGISDVLTLPALQGRGHEGDSRVGGEASSSFLNCLNGLRTLRPRCCLSFHVT